MPSDEKKAELLDDFLARYREPSFGAMPKREIDILVMGLSFATEKISPEDSDQKISRFLRISSSKVKALRYEHDLRNIQEQGQEWVKNQLRALLPTARLHADKQGGKVDLHVPNALLRREIEDLVHSHGHFSDYSFNRDILVLRANAFADLIEHALPEQARAIEAALRTESKKLRAELPELLDIFLRAAAEGAGHAAGQGTVELLVGLFDGGTKAIGQYAKTIFNRSTSA